MYNHSFNLYRINKAALCLFLKDWNTFSVSRIPE